MSDCRYGADASSYAFSLAKGNTSCEADAVGALVELLEQVRLLTEYPAWGFYLGWGVCHGASRQPWLEISVKLELEKHWYGSQLSSPIQVQAQRLK